MSERKRTLIPDTAAGRLAFDVFRTVTIRRWDDVNNLTSDFAFTNFPDCETVSFKYANKQFRHIVKTSGGELITIIYDITTKAISTERSPSKSIAKKGREAVGSVCGTCCVA